MSINRIMSQGKQALAATQIGLNTVSHNISNVNTEGYSRQRVDFQATEPTVRGNLQLGGGVKVGAVTRASSDFINRRLEEEKTTLGRFEGMSEVLSQLETVYKDDGDEGLSKTMSQFFNSVRSLSTQPESQPLRTALRESAMAVTNRFQSLVNGADQVAMDIDRRIEGSVVDINMLTKRVSDLNRRIMEVEVPGGPKANDERDSRDLALQQLSRIVDIQITPIENGGINVAAGRFGMLVNGIEPSQYSTVRSDSDASGGQVRILQANYMGRPGKDVTSFVSSGALGGYVHVRDELMPKMKERLNDLAFEFTRQVNGVHEQAFGLNGSTGVSFFAPIESRGTAATSIRISADVQRDLANISTAFRAGASGDNRALLDLADLQDKKIFEGGTSSFGDQTATLVGTLGVDVKTTNENLETQTGLVQQLNSAREEISGVSLDEETITLIQFQKAFDASAKMIQVADNLMDTVLSLKKF